VEIPFFLVECISKPSKVFEKDDKLSFGDAYLSLKDAFSYIFPSVQNLRWAKIIYLQCFYSSFKIYDHLEMLTFKITSLTSMCSF
jgi:hypothetical protein